MSKNFKHDYYFPEKKELLCMRCASLIARPGMPKGEILSNYHERKIILTGKDGSEKSSILILCSSCSGFEITDEEMTDAKTQIINGFEKQRSIPGVKSEYVDMSQKIFNDSTIKQKKEI